MSILVAFALVLSDSEFSKNDLRTSHGIEPLQGTPEVEENHWHCNNYCSERNWWIWSRSKSQISRRKTALVNKEDLGNITPVVQAIGNALHKYEQSLRRLTYLIVATPWLHQRIYSHCPLWLFCLHCKTVESALNFKYLNVSLILLLFPFSVLIVF